MDDSSDFKTKLQALYNDKNITKRLRTHLRQLILSELQQSNVDKKYPLISIKARAIGAFIVEWLHFYDCHYTLSVLASEIPSLADLPMLSSEGSQKKLKDDELEEVLSVLGVASHEIITDYQNNNISLMATVLKTAAAWKGRLEFKELPLTPRFSNEKEQKWANRLIDIISDTHASPGKLPSIYSALHSFIQSEVEDRISSERHFLFDELLLRENNIKEKLKEQEEIILSKLVEVKQDINQTKGKAEEELVQKRHMVKKLMEEVQTQHQAVVGGLSELKIRENIFNDEKKLWQKLKENEMLKLKEKSKYLKSKEEELKEMAIIIAGKEAEFQEKLNQRAVQNQSTSTSLKFETDNEKRLLPSTSSKWYRSKVVSDETKPSLIKQREETFNDGCQHNTMKIITSSTSDSSSSSFNQSDGTHAATLRRIEELREETKRNMEGFHEVRRGIDSDSSSSDGDSPNALKLHRKETLSHPQITLPFVREGCHSSTHSHNYPSSSRSMSKRYQSLLNQGDHLSKSLSSRDFFKKSQPTRTTSKNSEALAKLKEESKILENLIQAARKQVTTTRPYEEDLEKQRIIRDGKKIKSLMESVRVKSPNSAALSQPRNSSERIREEIITEETNLFGAGESVENSVSPPAMLSDFPNSLIKSQEGDQGQTAEKEPSRSNSAERKEPVTKVDGIQPSDSSGLGK